MTAALARKIATITGKGGLRLVEVANVLGTRPETVSRWNQGKAFPQPTKERQLLDLEWVVEQLADIYTPEESRLWLLSRQRLLGGAIPAELISQSKTEEVLALIAQLRDATYI